MNEITVINKSEILGQPVKVYGTPEEPLFLARDVAEWIDYAKSSDGYYQVSHMLGSVDDEEKLLLKVLIAGQLREAWFLTENGLYEVFMLSKKTKAKIFKTEVKKILKSIRKHGAYMTPATAEQILNNPDLMIELLQNFKAEREKVAQLEAKAEEDRPKVLFAQAVESSDNSILVGDLAKILRGNGVQIGQNRLFQQLREQGYLIKRIGADWNMPTQRSMELGVLEITERAIANPDGSVRLTRTPKVTGKGQTYFVNLFLGEKRLPLAE